ncbi:MAG: VOC family protein [Rhodospirillales bacterium]|nr:VOC family protein [Rhodospirillales bacterium]
MNQPAIPKADGPPEFKGFDHVSMPCRDLDEGIRFYRDVLGGEIVVKQPAFALFNIAGTRIGIGSDGCTFVTESAEYPHIAFHVGAEEQVQMKEWLGRCGVPTTDLWTRQGIESLMFFRDPSGNIIELFCYEGNKDAADFPRGPARGHGSAIDIDALYYTSWSLPGDAS